MPSLSIWEKESFFCAQDIIIVGSGFTGLWSALYLKQLNPHFKITILERGLIPTGASTRNAGFSCFGSPSELIDDAGVMGEENMWRLVAQRYTGLQHIRHFFSDDEIDYDPSGGYECFTKDSETWRRCLNKLSWLNKGLQQITGQEKLFTVADEKLAGFGFEGFEHMIENKLEGGLHPGKLVQALLKKVQGSGVQVLTGLEMIRFEEQENNVLIFTCQEIVLSTKQLLLCTNAFTGPLLPSIDIIPNRGQVLITGPIANLPFRGTFHFDKGYYYFRNVDNRLLLGGARNKAFAEENTASMETTPAIQQELESFASKYILPKTSFTITDRWTGIMAMGTEKSPLVKAIGKKVFCCVRMSGMGVALAPVVAKQVAEMMHDSPIT